MKPRPNGARRVERAICRPRTALLALLAGALLVAIVLLKGTDRPGDPGKVPEPARTAPRGERPVEARPPDPRRRSAERPAAPPRPRSEPDTRPRAPIAARVIDATGKLRSGIPLELVSADGAPGPGRALDAMRFSDANGSVHFPWPKAAAGKDLLLAAAMILEEPLVVPVPREPGGPVTMTIPESGEVVAAVVGPDSRPFEGPVTVMVLVAANDPWPAAALERASRPAVSGRARIPLVETGTLLLIEGRPADRSFTIAPRLVEGPASEGAVVETTLVARRRSVAESAPAPGVRFVASHLGPPSTAAAPGPREKALRIAVGPREALPRWPLFVEVGVRGAAGAPLRPAARADGRGIATLAVPPGRHRIACRLWRAMPDGWLTTDTEIAAAVELAPGPGRPAEIGVDRRALAAAAAALTGW